MMPRHLAVIMDGNGRWAKARGLSRSEGHKAGTEAAKAIVTKCRKLGIKHLTLYTFSKENWARPKDEIATLFDLLKVFLKKELSSLREQDIRLKILKGLSEFPFGVRQVIAHTIKKTENCNSMTLNLALNYSGRDEIVRACKKMISAGISEDEITEERISGYLYTAGQPDPDLIIRTSGEQRLSNYLLYQAAYSELYFTDVYWPDFSPEELDKAIADYAGRQRRFGKTGDQI
ncbi:polyprenyl diphosphate synthase [Maridesulfovibrio hydrothermalis]|uniref:Isoprenyl transferase n=1 Tax=Maridesulfovibrio hydrothermalis AM13 = DSM 14728 TaxID=1121451 RepID=L0RG42_9BACT|nr:polyprenyl diphosphate synthase [Maridesulfovibrio hydrothermalis]CCO25180.1 undecaprenyl pyrophosphate synthase [Maridesulfovibrio hydrothermalis AM13 = DSM 14728]